MLTTGESGPAHVTSASRQRSVWYAGRLLTVLAAAEETSGRFSLVEDLAQKETGLEQPLHVQTRETVWTYVIAGELTVRLDHEAIRVASGACVVIPPGVPHRYEVTSDRARLLHVYAPGGFEGFFRDLGDPVDSLTQPATPLSVERLVGVAAKYGVEIVAPEPDET